jgi:uncharacterized phage protein (TIGR01671 family)
MREIKFRAWDKPGQKMITLFDIETTDGVFSGGKYLELMQYTGLQNRNGTDIYEGDIVNAPYGRYKWNANKEEDESKVLDYIPSQIIFSNLSWYAKPLLGKKTFHKRIGRRHYMFPTHHHKCEVIGNIYENPELLQSAPPAGKEENDG